MQQRTLNSKLQRRCPEFTALQSMYSRLFAQPAIQTIYLGTNPGRSPASRAMLQDLQGVEQMLLNEYDELLQLLNS